MVRLRLLLPLVASAALITSVGCDLWPFGPSKSVAGNWRFASASPSTSRVYEMSLMQTGDSISGVVCVYDTLVLRPIEASVTGDYPRVRFTDPFVAACEYDLEFEEDQDEIAGDCVRSLVRFSRGGSGKCEAARRTPTAP
jgi:hypothetical protein